MPDFTRKEIEEVIEASQQFIDANLAGIDLSRAYLSRASLHRTDLREADLSRAYLRGTNLSGADLSEANLHDANLNGADLSDANLTGAELNYAMYSKYTTFPKGFDSESAGMMMVEVSV